MNSAPAVSQSLASRYEEIDLLRTLAIAMMVIYHTLYDLESFYSWSVLGRLGIGGWLLARSTAILFLLLVGVTSAISWGRAPSFAKAIRRAVRILGAALLVSFATFFVDPETYVRFGILHLIGFSALLLPLVARLHEGNALFGLGLIVIGNAPLFPSACPSRLSIVCHALLPLGIPPWGFTTVDYFPFLPWFGILLLGSALGHLLYVRCPQWRSHTACRLSTLLTWPGRHSLLLYLIHQPLILLLLTLLLGLPELYSPQ